MAVMVSTRTLRKAPDGDPTGVIAQAGTKVDILDDRSPPWIQVRLLGVANNPVGWVSTLAVDPRADAVVGPLDKLMFADECARQALIWGATAHYIMSVSEARTRITDGPAANGIDTGPFALSPSEWACYGALPDPEFQLNFLPDDIKDWRLQCALFSVATVSCQQKLAALLGDQPTATQLYFAQILGAKSAIDGIRNPNKNISDLLAAVSAEDFKSEGLEPTRIVTRYSSLLQGVNAQTALKKIDEVLQKALDSTRQFIVQVGTDILDTPSIPSGTLNEPDSLASLTHEQFIEFVGQSARKAMAATGVPASVTVAQAIRETGWGRHTIGDAKNLFGIKGSGPAGSVSRPTREVLNGRSVTVQANFAKYNSFEESIVEHAKFFLKNRRYGPALAVKNDPNSFAREIQKAGYATDRGYAAALIALMQQFNLYRFDSGP